LDLYNHRKDIGKNLSLYIRLKGYSKSSFSRLVDISRPTLNQILSGESPRKTFKEQITQITQTLNLPLDYFLTKPAFELDRWRTPAVQYSDNAPEGERNLMARELLEDLDQLMSMAALYL